MNQITSKQLIEINRQFYQQTANDFSNKRQYVWEGWKILADKYLEDFEDLRVLDIGCGNGRFGKFLYDNFEDVKYTGVDFSQELLNEAKVELKNFNGVRLIKQDLDSLITLQNDHVTQGNYNLVVMFGVMHHAPGFENRVKLLKQAINLTGNMLVVSFWQFADFPRFQNKIVSWNELSEIGQNELEQGDYLLDFNDSLPYRYCHSFSDEEIEKIMQALEMNAVADYQSDGKQKYNKYFVLSRTINTQ